MIPRRYLLPLSLALAVGAAPLLAQDAQPGSAQPAADAPKGAPAPQSSAGKKDTGDGTNAKPRADSGGESPFDYRASEEISEDLPVSFPADI